jgi:hypothetical protein
MQLTQSYHQELFNRISPIVENLLKSNSLYLVKLKKHETVEMLVDLFSKFSPEEMAEIGSIPNVEIYRFCSAGFQPASRTTREQDAPTTNYFCTIGMLPRNKR